jgi:hypothetical protein
VKKGDTFLRNASFKAQINSKISTFNCGKSSLVQLTNALFRIIKCNFKRYRTQLKRALFILFLIPLKFVSQVAAPDLRCIEVLANGDIKLTWISPADPGGNFFSYEVFSSISSSGPFTNSGSISAIATTSFIHGGAGGNVQSRYYFIKTKSGVGGASVSSPSDTLRSIFLNIIPSVPDLKLQYNQLHLPKLPTTVSSFTIAKEYPAAIWNIHGITTKTNYADTISVCSASLNYQVTQLDGSGCVSTSNIQGGVYNDKKAPDMPEVDSISVLPNGQTVIAWTIPRDKDIVDYAIYESIGGINTWIDTINGRPTTLYTYTSTAALNAPLPLYVAAIDSCKQIGPFDILPTTMHLKTTYDKCAYKTSLQWNTYQGMKSGVLEYRIYYSVNGSAYVNVGATTGTSFVHTNVSPAQNISYFVRVINNNKNITASSNRSGFFSTQVSAAGFVYIRSVTVLSKTSVGIDVYLDTSKSSQGIHLYRSTDGSYYTHIGFATANSIPFYSFSDEDADTKNVSYFYKAVVSDSCGNSRTTSNIAKTILLKVQEDKNDFFTKKLTWTDYKGFAGGVSGYNIYRIVNDVQSSIPAGTRGPGDTTYTDVLEDEAPNGSKIDYKVEAVEGISNPYSFMERSNSNLVPVYIEGDVYVPNAFAPRGRNKEWLPVTHFVDKSEYSVTVYNRWGNKVFETNDDTKSWDGAGMTPDVYIYLIRFKNSRGEYKEVKGSVTLLQ